MVHVKNILWPTDLSPASRYALSHARALAEGFHASLYLLHVVENAANRVYGRVGSDYRAVKANARHAAQVFLRQYAEQELHSVSAYQLLVHEGAVVEEILGTIKEKEIGTVVMATHGRSGMQHLLLGSVAEKVLRLAPCPVLVVPPPQHGRAT